MVLNYRGSKKIGVSLTKQFGTNDLSFMRSSRNLGKRAASAYSTHNSKGVPVPVALWHWKAIDNESREISLLEDAWGFMDILSALIYEDLEPHGLQWAEQCRWPGAQEKKREEQLWGSRVHQPSSIMV